METETLERIRENRVRRRRPGRRRLAGSCRQAHPDYHPAVPPHRPTRRGAVRLEEAAHTAVMIEARIETTDRTA
jgi:hypothetical protein